MIIIIAGNSIRGNLTNTQRDILLAAFAQNKCLILDNVQADEARCLHAYLNIDSTPGYALSKEQRDHCSSDALGAPDTKDLKDENYQNSVICKEFATDDLEDILFSWVPLPDVVESTQEDVVAVDVNTMKAAIFQDQHDALCSEYVDMYDHISSQNKDISSEPSLSLTDTTVNANETCGTVGLPFCQMIINNDLQSIKTSSGLLPNVAYSLSDIGRLYYSGVLASNITTNSYSWLVNSVIPPGGSELCTEAYCQLIFVSFDVAVNPDFKMAYSNGQRQLPDGDASPTEGHGVYGQMGKMAEQSCDFFDAYTYNLLFAGNYFDSWEISSAYFDDPNMAKVYVYPTASVNTPVSYNSSNENSNSSTVSVSGTVGVNSSGEASASVSAGYSETNGSSSSSSASVTLDSLTAYGLSITNDDGYISYQMGLNAATWADVNSLSGAQNDDKRLTYPVGGSKSTMPLLANVNEYTERFGFFVIKQKSQIELADTNTPFKHLSVDFKYNMTYAYGTQEYHIICSKGTGAGYSSKGFNPSSGKKNQDIGVSKKLSISTTAPQKSLKYASETFTKDSSECVLSLALDPDAASDGNVVAVDPNNSPYDTYVAGIVEYEICPPCDDGTNSCYWNCPDGSDGCYWHMINLQDSSSGGLL